MVSAMICSLPFHYFLHNTENVISPENFGRLLVEDLGEPQAAQLVPIIADEIRRQVEHCTSISEDDFRGNEPSGDSSKEKCNSDIRTIIKV